MIIISGASGFIGSCLVSYLNSSGITNLILIDKFDNKEKLKNLQNKHYSSLIDRDDFHTFIHENDHKIDFFFHLGARTDTGETNKSVFDKQSRSILVLRSLLIDEEPIPYGQQGEERACL